MNQFDAIINEIRRATDEIYFEIRDIEQIERGGTNVIFKGFNDTQQIAIKVLEKSDDKKWLYRLRQEYEVIKKLEHRRIVKSVGLSKNVLSIEHWAPGVLKNTP
jgi:hypothetical protein